MKRKRRIKKYRSLADVRFVKVLLEVVFALEERLKEEEDYLRHLLENKE